MQTNVRRKAQAWLALAGLGVWLAAAQPAGATFVYHVDFQNDTAGANPSLADYITEGGGNVVEVVDGASTPADPFGGAGNLSLWLQDTNAISTDAVAGFRSVHTNVAGKLTMKLFFTQDATYPTPYLEVRGFDDGVDTLDGRAQGSEIGPWIWFRAASVSAPILIRIFTSGPTLTLDQTAPSNTVNTLEIDFNAKNDTFTAKLNGTPLTAGGGTTNVFPFYSPLHSLDAVHLNAGFSTQAGVRVFVDDITLIPEPTTAALVALGALALLRRRRNR